MSPAGTGRGAGSCPGDCDGGDSVSIAELITGVGIALATRPIDDCPAFDVSGDGAVRIDELLMAVNAALAGCTAFAPTPTPTIADTATATASPTATAEPTLSTAWTEAFDASDAGWMMSGWGPGDGTLWVVGGTYEQGRIFRYAAGGWTEIDPGVPVSLLNWVHGTSNTDLFVGGDGGVMLHFDGNSWSLQPTPFLAAVWGIYAVAPDDVWAVGGDVIIDDPFVAHYDGTAWSLAAVPPLQRPRVHAFFKVWASGPDNVYIVGQNGIILHYDGSAFTELGVGVSQDLIGIWGTGPDNIMVVGGRGTAELVHFDGESWRRAPPSSLPGLNGVWLRRADVAHAVGVDGTVVRIDPRSLAVTERVAEPTAHTLHSIFGDPSGRMIALGGNFVHPAVGVALTRRLTDDD